MSSRKAARSPRASRCGAFLAGERPASPVVERRAVGIARVARGCGRGLTKARARTETGIDEAPPRERIEGAFEYARVFALPLEGAVEGDAEPGEVGHDRVFVLALAPRRSRSSMRSNSAPPDSAARRWLISAE